MKVTSQFQDSREFGGSPNKHETIIIIIHDGTRYLSYRYAPPLLITPQACLLKASSLPDYSLYGGADSPSPPSTLISSPDLSSASEDESPSTPPDNAHLPSAIRQRKGKDLPAAAEAEDEHLRIYGLERTDFLWTMTEEPHRSRRLQILKAHPEIKSLMGHSTWTKWIVLAVVALQTTCAVLLRETHPFSWKFMLTAYVIGGTANQNLFLSVHEITHNRQSLLLPAAWSFSTKLIFASAFPRSQSPSSESCPIVSLLW
jgi:hypothetical protein